jgi:hypothetical protein
VIGFRIDQAKGLFFDAPAVVKAVGRAERKVLSRFGAFVRRTARSSLRKRKKASEPGQPPSSHVGLVKQHLFFLWDPQHRSVVVGPVQLNRSDPNTLELLEHGGTATRRFVVIEEKKRRGTTRRVVSSRKAKPRTVRYRARPFMQPAFEKEQPKLADMWKDSVTE